MDDGKSLEIRFEFSRSLWLISSSTIISLETVVRIRHTSILHIQRQ